MNKVSKVTGTQPNLVKEFDQDEDVGKDPKDDPKGKEADTDNNAEVKSAEGSVITDSNVSDVVVFIISLNNKHAKKKSSVSIVKDLTKNNKVEAKEIDIVDALPALSSQCEGVGEYSTSRFVSECNDTVSKCQPRRRLVKPPRHQPEVKLGVSSKYAMIGLVDIKIDSMGVATEADQSLIEGLERIGTLGPQLVDGRTFASVGKRTVAHKPLLRRCFI